MNSKPRFSLLLFRSIVPSQIRLDSQNKPPAVYFVIILFILFGLSCSSSKFDEEKGKQTIERYLASRTVADLHLVLKNVGPFFSDEKSASVKFTIWYYWGSTRPDNPSSYEYNDAIFQKSQDGKWYLTQITAYAGFAEPNLEVR